MTDLRATLSFRTGFRSSELSGLELPVEIRRGDMRLVARTLTTRQVRVEPGEYYVSSRLPAGQQMQAYVAVGAGETRIVDLQPDVGDRSPAEDLEVQHFLRRSVRRASEAAQSVVRPLESLEASSLPSSFRMLREWLGDAKPSFGAPGPTLVSVRWFAGNPLQATRLVSASDETPDPWQNRPLQIPAEALSTREPVTCQILQADQPAVNTRIPIPREGPPPEITLLVPEPGAPTYRIGIRLAHATADLLTRYLRRGMFSEASEAIASDSMDGERLLLAKGSDPIAAAVGAYTLLRTGELPRSLDWTQNLEDWFEWLPDGAAIHGEHLARRGEHLKACRALLLLGTRGLPLFTEGLSYALERLRLYTQERTTPKGLGADETISAQELLRRLGAFVPYLDFDRTYVTYTGKDPASPWADDEVMTGEPPGGKADLSKPDS